MDAHSSLRSAIVLLATVGATTPASASCLPQDADVRALDGEWIFVEDRTEGRPVERQQPSMSARVRLRVEDDAIVLIRSDGEVRMALDGTPTDVVQEFWVSRYRGTWRDGAFI